LHDPYVKSTRPYDSPTRREHAELTRRRILDALIDLMVDERPATISIPAVAKRANVSVRTVYHHFATKEALFDALAAAPQERGGGSELPQPQSPKELAAGMRAAYVYLEHNADLFNAVRASEVEPRVRGQLDRRANERMRDALAPIADRLDDEAFARLCAIVGALVSNDTYRNLTRRYGLPRDEAADVAAWAITTLTDRAKRTGRVGTDE
jgi:AcrR family transcriptional regulator